MVITLVTQLAFKLIFPLENLILETTLKPKHGFKDLLPNGTQNQIPPLLENLDLQM